MTHKTDQVLVACKDDAIATRLAQVLNGEYTVTFATSWIDSMESIIRHQHQILIVDPILLPESAAECVEEICHASPDTRILILETRASPEINQVKLFQYGVHGFCNGNIAPELLLKAVNAVCSGELWLQRSLITQVIDELARIRTPGSGRKVKCLTPRELQVAQMVHKGGNNKMIARELDISERTVKAHLSAIFRKLNIENRLHLALFLNDAG